MRLVLATCRELPHLDADEEHLVRALQARGLEPAVAVWDAGDAPFLDADLTVIRSTWDYTARVDDFVAWAARVEAGARIENKASVVRWNTHKRYLADLAGEGIAVVPTAHLSGTATATATATARETGLRALLEARGWTRGAIVKPAVSAGSKDTVRVRGLDVDEGQALLDALLPTRDMMVQPWVEGVTDGEISLIYVDGAFTHAVNKVPREGDFRSQPEFGSVVTRVEPTREQRRAADAVLAAAGGNLLYARADLVRGDDGAPWLMELELVEPSLYLAHHPPAADALAGAIAKRLDAARRGRAAS